jgi:hypothetical protein
MCVKIYSSQPTKHKAFHYSPPHITFSIYNLIISCDANMLLVLFSSTPLTGNYLHIYTLTRSVDSSDLHYHHLLWLGHASAIQGDVHGLLIVETTLHLLLTYSMVQSPSWEANWFVASQEIPRIFMEPEGSLPHSQASATCPYPVPAQSSPHTHIPPPGDPS